MFTTGKSAMADRVAQLQLKRKQLEELRKERQLRDAAINNNLATNTAVNMNSDDILLIAGIKQTDTPSQPFARSETLPV